MFVGKLGSSWVLLPAQASPSHALPVGKAEVETREVGVALVAVIPKLLVRHVSKSVKSDLLRSKRDLLRSTRDLVRSKRDLLVFEAHLLQQLGAGEDGDVQERVPAICGGGYMLILYEVLEHGGSVNVSL
jgi:hypothetical protein